jgi:hypothetical protein
VKNRSPTGRSWDISMYEKKSSFIVTPMMLAQEQHPSRRPNPLRMRVDL